MNYDPNLVFCGRMAVQTVRLTFGEWEYRKTVEVAVGGNCRGAEVIEQAVENAYNQLPGFIFGGKTITMLNEKGDELESSEHEGDGDESDWLRNLLIAAEITAITPERTDA